MTLDKIAMNIKVERVKSRMSQETVSNLLGVTRATYIAYEKHGRINTDVLVKLSNIFQCNINNFFVD